MSRPRTGVGRSRTPAAPGPRQAVLASLVRSCRLPRLSLRPRAAAHLRGRCGCYVRRSRHREASVWSGEVRRWPTAARCGGGLRSELAARYGAARRWPMAARCGGAGRWELAARSGGARRWPMAARCGGARRWEMAARYGAVHRWPEFAGCAVSLRRWRRRGPRHLGRCAILARCGCRCAAPARRGRTPTVPGRSSSNRWSRSAAGSFSGSSPFRRSCARSSAYRRPRGCRSYDWRRLPPRPWAFRVPLPRQPPASATTVSRQAKRAAQPHRERPSSNMPGGVLLSHAVPRAVPSALKSLTSGFGMGPGVSPSL
jgi:hypothetical protein